MKDKARNHRVHVSDYLLIWLLERVKGWMFPSRAERGHVGASDLLHQTPRLGLPDVTAKTLRTTAVSHWQTLELSEPCSEEP